MSHFKFLLMGFLALILQSQVSSAIQEESSFRIINGETCDITQVPFLVIIRSQKTCGGSLLSYSHVLTAAHCILPQYIDSTTTVRSGHTSPDLVQIRGIARFRSHSKFDSVLLETGQEIRYDIGLILVNESFYKTSFTQLATLAPLGFAKKCSRGWAAGVGRTYNGENVWAKPFDRRPIKCVNLSILETDICKINYPRATIDDTIICTEQQGKDTCQGDSGGPLLCENVVIGIVSYGRLQCATGSATYTKIESYYDFIDKVKSEFGEILPKRGRMKGSNSSISEKVPDNMVQSLVANWKLVLFTFVLVRFIPLTQ